jgi:hypothetical protein
MSLIYVDLTPNVSWYKIDVGIIHPIRILGDNFCPLTIFL